MLRRRSLTEIIEHATCTMHCLGYQREIKAAKQRIEIAKREHIIVKNCFEHRMEKCSLRLKKIMDGKVNMQHYREATKKMNDSNIGASPYVIRKQAEVIMKYRTQELFETYMYVTRQQMKDLFDEMYGIRQTEKRRVKLQQDALVDVRLKLMKAVAHNVESFSSRNTESATSRGFFNRRSMLQRLVSSNRLLDCQDK